VLVRVSDERELFGGFQNAPQLNERALQITVGLWMAKTDAHTESAPIDLLRGPAVALSVDQAGTWLVLSGLRGFLYSAQFGSLETVHSGLPLKADNQALRRLQQPE
jgi:hypothetical protein